MLIAALGTLVGILVYTTYFQKAPVKDITDQSQDGQKRTTAPAAISKDTKPAAVSQETKLGAVVTHIRSIMPSVSTDQNTYPYIPHRKLGAPYNFYAVSSRVKTWSASTETISNVDTATTLTQNIYAYLTKEQAATAETLMGDATVAKLGSGDSLDMNGYRLTTSDYTCGLYEKATHAATTPYAVNGVTVSLGCAVTTDYEHNAAIQKPFYDAILSTKGYTADNTMLELPTVADSKSTGYQTAKVKTGLDSLLIGSGIGLFYRTPDNTWHFFMATQYAPGCEEYSTPDLKKAYLGTDCYSANANGATSTVSL